MCMSNDDNNNNNQNYNKILKHGWLAPVLFEYQ